MNHCLSNMICKLLTIVLLYVIVPAIHSHALVNDSILSYVICQELQNVQLFWKNDSGEILNTFQNVKMMMAKKKYDLIFCMNGGMFNKDFSPIGLFIQNNKILSPIDTTDGYGNFYLQPNGVLSISSHNRAAITQTSRFKISDSIKYATQSGPMLLIDGKIHPAFKRGSSNVQIRNGVGISGDTAIIFAMSKKEINLYDFAKYFLDAGCKNALYLDGFVSRCYLPEQNWVQLDGTFGVIIGVVKKQVRDQ